MIKKFLLLIIFSVFLSTLKGQDDTSSVIYFKSLPQLEVIDEQIYQLLDSLIFYNNQCIYTIHGNPYYFDIFLSKKSDTINIILGSNQYHEFRLKHYTNWIGCFYYKNIFIGVDSSDIFQSFFKKKSDTIDTYFEKQIIYYHFNGLGGTDCCYIEYNYINNNIIPIYKYLCTESSPYYHRIKEGETWEKIAYDYGISIEILISLNKRIKIKKPLKKGVLIRVY